MSSSSLWDVKVTAKPSHEDDILTSWVKIDGVDIRLPEKGSRTIRMGPGLYPIHLYASGRPGGTWTVTIESAGLTYPAKEKKSFPLRIDQSTLDDFISFRFQLDVKKKAKKKKAKKKKS